jgi:hypothetical protein
MTKKSRLTRTRSDGFERVEWLDSRERTLSILAIDPTRAAEVQPTGRVREPNKYHGQRSYQGHYWCAGTRDLVFHESMVEYGAMMLLDHLHELTTVHAQPMLLSFADGTVHYPDYLLGVAGEARLLVDVHVSSLTTDEDRHKFELTRQMCQRLGWGYELLNELSQATFWNLEMLARYRHHRFEPPAGLRDRIKTSAATARTFAECRAELRTQKPGEHMPGLFHMMWNRELVFDLTEPFTDRTQLFSN